MALRLGVARAPRRKPVQHEKFEQQHGVHLLKSLGAELYILGTRRATRCAHCGQVSKDLGTRQTPGISDVYGFLPPPRHRPEELGHTAFWWEVKAHGGRLSDDQWQFKALCHLAGVNHVGGDLNALFAFLIAGGWLLEKNVATYRRPNDRRSAS